MSLSDRTLSLSPELFYKGMKNLRFRFKLTALFGAKGTEFGEKENDYRLEIEGEVLFLTQVVPPLFPPGNLSQSMDEQIPSEELMARIAKGDNDAFEILVNRHQTSILNLVYRFIGDRTQAKDLAQEVLIRVWQAAGSYQPKAKFTTWIYRITANLCFNELKSARRRKWFSFNWSDEDGEHTIEETLSDGAPSAEDLLLEKERSRQISNALQSLPENQRMALILKRYDDLSYPEIAQIIGCSVSAVESLLVRAKRTLQEKLKDL
jgi:RNA polymerase sigma-70 factor (ECF subfamily)